MRATRSVTGGVALICLTCCGAPVSPGGPAHRQAGRVAGRVLRPPGTDPRSGNGAKAPVPVNGDPVEAHELRGRIAGKAVTAARGRFAMTLRPGTYRIVEGICGVSKRIAVRGGATTPVTLTVPNAC